MNQTLSLARGIPLCDEPGLGALTLPGYLSEVALRFADHEAVVMHHDDGRVERWSYAQLWERSLEVARALVGCGIGKDSRVGVLMTNRPEWLAAFFGVGLAGGVAVTLSTFSTAPELEYLIQASCISILLFEEQVLQKNFAAILLNLEPNISDAKPGSLSSLNLPHLRHLVQVGDSRTSGAIERWQEFLLRGEHVERAQVEAMASSTKPADTAVIFFSSGSTGKPKGIISSHRAVVIQFWRWRRVFGLGDDVRCWTANGFFFSGSFSMAIGGTLSSGGALILQRTFEAAAALKLMQAEKVTFPRAWLHQWERLKAEGEWNSADLSSFHYVDPIYTASQKTVVTDWSDPRWSYGNTETFTIVTNFPVGTPDEIGGDSYGEPLPGCTIKIVDPDSGETLPTGERGELAVKGPTLMLGYVGVPIDETLDADGFFRTGDGGWLDEKGRFFWEGRLNDIIKTGGANVSPLEVDGVLSLYPGIKVNLTVGVLHRTLGEMVVACVVPHEGANLEETQIRDFLKQRLASYKVPRRVLFLRDEELSFTGSAKVRSNALREVASRMIPPDAPE